MKTYSDEEARGMGRFRPDGTPPGKMEQLAGCRVTAANTGSWWEEDRRSCGRRCAGGYSSLSSASGADGESGATAQAPSAWAEINRRIRRWGSHLIGKSVLWVRNIESSLAAA